VNPVGERGILIPAFRAERTVGEVVRRLRSLYPATEILVVDDGSDDATSSRAAEAGALVERLPRNAGKGSALARGLAILRERGCHFALCLDADGQHLPEDAGKFLSGRFPDDCGVVVGARRLHPATMPWPRVCSNRLTTFLLELQARKRLWDSQCGYRMYRLDAVAAARVPTSGRFEWESEALVRLARAGYSVAKVDIATVYGSEESHIRPWRDTARFVRLWLRLWTLPRIPS
jgi:glycosyltransferase involved in cell wall biosynthesis